MALDELVPRPLLIQHHRREPAFGKVFDVHRRRMAAERHDAQCIREPFGRIDGQDHRAFPGQGSTQRQRGGGGRLAHPATAGTNDDAVTAQDVFKPGHDDNCGAPGWSAEPAAPRQWRAPVRRRTLRRT